MLGAISELRMTSRLIETDTRCLLVMLSRLLLSLRERRLDLLKSLVCNLVSRVRDLVERVSLGFIDLSERLVDLVDDLVGQLGIARRNGENRLGLPRTSTRGSQPLRTS